MLLNKLELSILIKCLSSVNSKYISKLLEDDCEYVSINLNSALSILYSKEWDGICLGLDEFVVELSNSQKILILNFLYNADKDFLLEQINIHSSLNNLNNDEYIDKSSLDSILNSLINRISGTINIKCTTPC